MGETTVYTFKLVTGEEIIAKARIDLSLDDSVELALEDARSVVFTQQGMKLGPVAFSIDPKKPLKLNIRTIVAYTDALRDEFKEAYQNAVSPITVPSKSIIMG